MNNIRVTVFKNIYDTLQPIIVELSTVVERIKIPKENVLKIINAIRQEEDKDKRNEIKRNLPAVCYAGLFERRGSSGLKQLNGIIVVDIDNYDNARYYTAENVREKIASLKYTLAAWLSPSGKGVHALIMTDNKDVTLYKLYYNAIVKELETIGIYADTNASDYARLLFFSVDEKIYFNPDCDTFKLPENIDDGESEIYYSEKEIGGIVGDDKERKIKAVVKWWKRKYNIADAPQKGERNTKLFILACALNRAGIELSGIVSVLTQYSGGLPDREIRSIANSASRNVHEFNTLQFHRMDEISQFNYEQGIYDNSEFDGMYEINKNGRINVVTHRLKQYIAECGFRYMISNGNIFPVAIDKGFVIILTAEEFGARVRELFKTQDEEGKMQYRPSPAIGNEFLEVNYEDNKFITSLPKINVNAHNDTANSVVLPFKNAVYEVHCEELAKYDYIDYISPVFEDDVLLADSKEKKAVNDTLLAKAKKDRENGKLSVFEMFINKVISEDYLSNGFIHKVIGYLIHSYIKPPLRRAVILTDEGGDASTPRGGTGKGLFVAAIGKIRNVCRIDLRTQSLKSQFAFSQITQSTRIVFMDEAPASFDFKDVYSMITEGISVEKKYQNSYTITGEYMPKIIIASNAGIKGIATSDARRRVDIKFKNYYNERFTPFDDFRHTFFKDWDDEEWHRFFYFILMCISHWLKNMHWNDEMSYTDKDIVTNIGSDNKDFFDGIMFARNTEYYIEKLLDEYLEYIGGNASIKKTTFVSMLKKYLDMKGIRYIYSNRVQKIKII